MWYSTAGNPSARQWYDVTAPSQPNFVEISLEEIKRVGETATPVAIRVPKIAAPFAFFLLLKLGFTFQCVADDTFTVPKGALEHFRRAAIAYEVV